MRRHHYGTMSAQSALQTPAPETPAPETPTLKQEVEPEGRKQETGFSQKVENPRVARQTLKTGIVPEQPRPQDSNSQLHHNGQQQTNKWKNRPGVPTAPTPTM
ncbi:MAG: hypothetical protein PHW76_08875 [Alphaproteobacteria bacterium]|nr:hypothetical protein [Alphaproteobacteria bacterium]